MRRVSLVGFDERMRMEPTLSYSLGGIMGSTKIVGFGTHAGVVHTANGAGAEGQQGEA